jgi:hypothetical protein
MFYSLKESLFFHSLMLLHVVGQVGQCSHCLSDAQSELGSMKGLARSDRLWGVLAACKVAIGNLYPDKAT